MAENNKIEQLKWLLRREVALFCRHNDRKWKVGISNTIDEIRANNWSAVFFGGTLRSLLISRLIRNTLGRPRDIDIVIRGVALQDLEWQFEQYISRQTRFGGIQLRRVDWKFDLWPLEQTFYLKKQQVQPEFHHLPSSTFLNLEAIAVEVWPQPGRPRVVYSGDDQFFQGIISRTIEINREENPFPELCVVRSLVIAGSLQWRIGPRLFRYLVTHGAKMSEADFNEIQRKHYGRIEWPGELFRRVLDRLSPKGAAFPSESVELPLPKQLRLWTEEDAQWPRIHLSTVNGQASTQESLGQ